MVSGSGAYSSMRSKIDSQPFTFPGLVSISMTSTRDKGLTAVTMPIPRRRRTATMP